MKTFNLKFLTLILLAVFASKASASSRLIYKSPSEKWMGSLPLGNGRIGAMVYGGTSKETIAMNEVTLWSGQPDEEGNNICGKDKLQQMRDCFFRGDLVKGNELGMQYLKGRGKSFGTHLPFGDLVINFKGREGQPVNYSRTLDMAHGEAIVDYSIGDVRYTNTYFCSNPAQVFVANFSASKSKQVSAQVGLKMLRHNRIRTEGHQIIIEGDACFDKWGAGGVKYYAVMEIKAKGGKVQAGKNTISVEGADEMTVMMDIRTDFRNPDYVGQCKNTVAKASKQGYKSLEKKHASDFNRLYARMDLHLGNNDAAVNTDEAFKQARQGNPSPDFDATFFQYGRYMLLSSSRQNSPLPANLQGIWNDNLACNMPWTCDYHLDVNIEQNYWSANIANMAECNAPLFSYIKLLSKYGHETAKKMYDCDGWVAHTVNNVWGATYPGDGVSWAMNITAGAWQATQLWVHFLYTQDKDYLRQTGYPLLKETAKFFVDYMVKDPNTGYLVTGPSISPENGYRTADGHDLCLSMMPTIDRAVVHYIYAACIEASKLLNTDAEFRTRLEHDIKLLPPYQIGPKGDLKEWNLDVTRSDYSHRHSSHLLGLYPFGEISPERTPDLAKSCSTFLTLQTSNASWEDTEWTRGNMICYYARLLSGNKAYESLKGLYKGFMRENLMTVSPAGIAGAEEDIFSFDATEAAVAGTCEMILQSYDGYLNFLPALPEEWRSGWVKGICAEGAIEADIAWKDCKVTSVVLRSKSNQTVRCKINGAMYTVSLKAGKGTRVI